MATTFVRSLGSESGVQLNPLQDNSEIPTQDNADQVFGIVMRATRGRIDKPFVVDRSNVKNKLGYGERISASALNEAWVHVVEALNNGAYQAVVQRLSTDAATISYAVAFQGSGLVLGAVVIDEVSKTVVSIAVTSGGTGYGVGPDIVIAGVGTGAVASATVVDGVVTAISITGGVGYTVAPTATVVNSPKFAVLSAETFEALTVPYLFALKHLECFNDGIKLNLRAEEYRVSGANAPNSKVTLIMTDILGQSLYEFTGSLVAGSHDDYGNSNYLPDIIASQTDSVEITIGGITSIPVDSRAYGYSATTGQANWAKSGKLVCFVEGGMDYTPINYIAAKNSLQFTPFNYSYISSGGSKSAGLLAQLAQLSFDTNRQFRYDIPGDLSIAASIALVEQLNFSSGVGAHLIHVFYSPLKRNDPTGVNGKGFYGTATLNIAYACMRNAQTNGRGFAPKHYPIAGRNWPIGGSGIVQAYTPTDQELSALARAKINPCLFESYTGGGRYVFRDSLTSALVDSSLKKLIAVADMSTSIDDAVTRNGKDNLQLPIDIAIKRTKDYLKMLFEGAQAAGWLVPSDDPEMGGAAFKFEVKANAVRPYDRMDVNFWLRYSGTVRQIFVTQTLTK